MLIIQCLVAEQLRKQYCMGQQEIALSKKILISRFPDWQFKTWQILQDYFKPCCQFLLLLFISNCLKNFNCFWNN